MLRRLPISLRFDDEDSDFYFGFIEQKKNDRELSSLILDLLHVYYENEEVRNIVNDYVIQKSPYMQIHEQLERIALEHSRQTVSTNMLNDFTDNARKKISEPPEPVKEEKKEVTEEPLLLAAAMDKLGPMIEQKVTELFSQMVSNSTVNSVPTEVVKGVSQGIEMGLKEEVKNIPIAVPTAPPVVTPSIPSTAIPPVVEKPRMEKPVISKPSVDIEIDTPEVVPTERKPGKPASFGKLIGSVR